MAKPPNSRFFRDLNGRDDGMFMSKGAGAPMGGMAPASPNAGGDDSTKLNIGATGAPMGGSGFRGQGMGGGMYGTGKGVAKKAGASPSDWDADSSLPTGFHRPASEQPEELEPGGERFHSTDRSSVVSASNRQRHGLVEGGSMSMAATASPQMGKHASVSRFMGTSYGIEKSASPDQYIRDRAGEVASSIEAGGRGVAGMLDDGVKAVTRSPVAATLGALLAARVGLGGARSIGKAMRRTPPKVPVAMGGSLVNKLRGAAGRLAAGARNFVTK